MKPDFIDEIGDYDGPGPEPLPEKVPKRGDWYPYYYEDSGSAKRVMQLPARFRHLWVVKPIKELEDYSNKFTFHKEIEFNGDIIRSYTSPLNHELIPDRPYKYLLDVLLGGNGKEPLFPALKINGINDNVTKCIDKITADGDIHYVDLWSCFYDNEWIIFAKKDLPLWFSFLKTIPVEIVTDSRMEAISPSFIKGLIKRNPDDSIENISEIMETLGLYCPQSHNDSLPSIYLCKERIDKVAQKLGYDPDMLFVLVYLHELAHAAMDQTNEIVETGYHLAYNYQIHKNDKKSFATNKYTDFLEESLANMIMLQYANWYSEVTEDQTLFDTASSFVAQQAPMYKFGLDLFEADIDWIKWRDYKENHKEPGEELKEWFDNKDDFNTLKKIFD